MVRLSAGREDMTDETQALCFLAGANSIFYGPKLLTTANPVELMAGGFITPETEAISQQRQCLKGRLVPDDVARMVLWLAADDSAMVTAQHFVVDGGGS